MRLVADVGGTNTRIGLARGGDLRAGSLRRYRNDDFACFDAAVNAFLSETASPPIAEIVVAVAGPVSDGRARLTNRDWSISAAALSDRFGDAPAFLLNDLSALGHASPHLGPDCLDLIVPADTPRAAPEQSLVVGIGTGFNVSPVIRTENGVVCLKAEMGHVQLPLDVAERLARGLGPSASRFRTVEDVFSGRGYAAVSDLFPAADPQDGSAQAFYAALLGLLTRNLMLAFLPRSGIFFAGGVARNLLSTPARAEFIRVFGQPFALDQTLAAPVFSIRDDAAALLGCAKYQPPG